MLSYPAAKSCSTTGVVLCDEILDLPLAEVRDVPMSVESRVPEGEASPAVE